MKTIAVDLDGVIFEYDRWRGVEHFGETVRGAKTGLECLRQMGYKIVVYTARLNTVLSETHSREEVRQLIANELVEREIPFDEVSAEKPHAEFYIDDRAIYFRTWSQVLVDVADRREG